MYQGSRHVETCLKSPIPVVVVVAIVVVVVVIMLTSVVVCRVL